MRRLVIDSDGPRVEELRHYLEGWRVKTSTEHPRPAYILWALKQADRIEITRLRYLDPEP